MMNLDWATIKEARQTLELPTDPQTMEELETDLQSRLSELADSIHSRLERNWFKENSGQMIPSEVSLQINQQALIESVSQIMEDEVNEPMRNWLMLQEDQAEMQRQEAS